MAAGAALAVLQATSAHAVLQDDKVNCFTGTSGTVCSRLRWDAGAYFAVAYGAKDPKSPYWIRYDALGLRCDYGSGPYHCIYHGPFNDPNIYGYMSYESVSQTVYAGQCVTFWSDFHHSTYGGSYLARTPGSTKCR